MGHIADLGYRIELISMDPHFHDISIGLNEQRDAAGQPRYLVHTYSERKGAKERIDFVVEAMRTLGGLEECGNGARYLRFPCGAAHRQACKRTFLEACKLESGSALTVRPLSIFDKKLDGEVFVESEGAGAYRLSAEGNDERKERRLTAIAGGLIKLAEVQPRGEQGDSVAFECGQEHDALVGLLLARALNVRAVVREQEQAATRGVLAAPSARES